MPTLRFALPQRGIFYARNSPSLLRSQPPLGGGLIVFLARFPVPPAYEVEPMGWILHGVCFIIKKNQREVNCMKVMVFDVGGTEIKYSVMDETMTY